MDKIVLDFYTDYLISSFLYHTPTVSLPVAFALVTRPDFVTDKKTGKEKRQARVSKNEHYLQMVQTCVLNDT